MSKSIKLFLIFTLISLGLGLNSVVLAQENSNNETNVDVQLDETITADDLGITEPTLLPDSPLYFLKDWGRGIQSFFTFDKVKKAELKMKFANEKLIEVKKLIEENKDPKIIGKGLKKYEEEIDKIGKTAEKIKDKASDNPNVDKFSDKFIKQQVLQEKILQKLETQVPPEVFEKIKEAREKHLEKFGEVMTKLENKEKIPERLEKNLEELKGSKFKNFKNLEILKNLEEKVPEEAKEAIQKAQENALKRLKGDLEKMSSEDQEKFKDYIDKISGSKENQFEILENLKSELKDNPVLQEKLLEAREKIMERVKERIIQKNCPEIEKPAPGFCSEGRISVKKDEKGCIVSFECVIPAEIELPEKPESAEPGKPAACVTLWDPVCGNNGKTYSNACFAKLAGVAIAYKGQCRTKECQTDADCPQLKCGPVVKCVGAVSKCIEGKCQVQSITKPKE